MCYHDSKDFTSDSVSEYYHVPVPEQFRDEWKPYYYENGFAHHASPVLYGERQLGFFNWGLVPWFMKPGPDVARIRKQTINCISEEMYSKRSFKDSLKQNMRCLVPLTGFFEWKWSDAAGKEKTPYYIFLKNQPIFSVAGLYSTWHDKATDKKLHTFTLLTTKANPLMARIHNSKMRMPVILPREYEQDWLNPNLTQADVLALCQPLDEKLMDAYVITKRISSRKESPNVPEVLARA